MNRAHGNAVQSKAPFATHPFQEPTSNVIALPTMVLLGCNAEMEARCRAITSRARVLLRAMPVPFLRSAIVAVRPLVLVVPSAVYDLAPKGFDMLIEESGSCLLKLDREPIATIVLEYRIMEALIFSLRIRSRREVPRFRRPTAV